MPITVSGKNVEIGDSLRAFVIAEVKEAMENSVGEFIGANVVINKDKNFFSCEVSVHISMGFSLRSSSQDVDAYNCVSHAINILKQRTKRYKARLKQKHRTRRDEGAMLSSNFVLASVQEEEKVIDNPVIIAEVANNISSLTVGDAVMQLDLSEVPVLVFKNSNTDSLNVVYKRADGNIVWVAPKKN